MRLKLVYAAVELPATKLMHMYFGLKLNPHNWISYYYHIFGFYDFLFHFLLFLFMVFDYISFQLLFVFYYYHLSLKDGETAYVSLCTPYWFSILKMQSSWIICLSVGSTPCLQGKVVDCNYIRGPKYLEVNFHSISL